MSDNTHCIGMQKVKIETGNRYNRLVAGDRVENKKNGQVQWLCKCDCGGVAIVSGKHLRSGQVKSCGCIKPGRKPSGVPKVKKRYLSKADKARCRAIAARLNAKALDLARRAA